MIVVYSCFDKLSMNDRHCPVSIRHWSVPTSSPQSMGLAGWRSCDCSAVSASLRSRRYSHDYIYIYIYTHVCMYICVYMYREREIHAYIYIYIYTCVYLSDGRPGTPTHPRRWDSQRGDLRGRRIYLRGRRSIYSSIYSRDMFIHTVFLRG